MTLKSRKDYRLFAGTGLVLSLLFAPAPHVTVTASAAEMDAVLQPQQPAYSDWWHGAHFELRSKTFVSGSTLPQSMILNAQALGSPPMPGCEGGNQSPELEWTNAPRQTRSFVIMLFDADASFVHWSIYNIPATKSSLPQNAGTPASPYGQEIFNDFGLQNYDGPCPPSSFQHHYVITIYAIDAMVSLNAPPQLTPEFLNLPTGETLFDALLEGRYHILASASMFGLYGLPQGATQNAVVRHRVP